MSKTIYLDPESKTAYFLVVIQKHLETKHGTQR